MKMEPPINLGINGFSIVLPLKNPLRDAVTDKPSGRIIGYQINYRDMWAETFD